MANDNTANDTRRISYVKMAAVAVSGTRPNLGDDRKVSM